jgi:hypothetical protein
VELLEDRLVLSTAATNAPQVINVSTPGFSAKGDWFYSNPGVEMSNSTAQDATAVASFQAHIDPGTYDLWTTWFTGGPRANDAPYTILDGSTPLASLRVNQQVDPVGPSDGGQVWQSLGRFTFQTDELTVTLSGDASNSVVADAIRFQAIDVSVPPTAAAAPATVMTIASPAFGATGGWHDDSSGELTTTAGQSGARDVATWQAQVDPGTYDVWTTWTPFAPRASDAPYTVLDGTTPLETIQVDQRWQPFGVTDGGTQWQSLGEFKITGNTLTVTLSGDADGAVVARAIRFQRVDVTVPVSNAVTPAAAASSSTPPTAIDAASGTAGVQVLNGSTVLADGSTVDLGTTTVGQSLTTTITVTDGGSGGVNLSDIQLPAGFVLDGVIASAHATAFTVKMSSTSVGTVQGTLSLTTTSSTSTQHQLKLKGSVTSPTSPTSPTSGSTTPTSGSTTPTSGSTTPTSGSTTPTSSSTTPTSGSTTPTSGSTTPTSGSTTPTSGSTTPTSGSTTPTSGSTTPTSGSTTPPSGSTTPTTPTSPTSPTSPTAPVATTPVILDNGTSAYQTTGAWQWIGQGYNSGTNYIAGGDGSSTATWQSTINPGTYSVWVTWPGDGPRATNAPFTIYDGTTPVATVRIDQRYEPMGITDQGTLWQALGTFAFKTNQLRVQLTNAADGYVFADAVRFQDATGTPLTPALSITGLADGSTSPESTPITLGSMVIQPTANGVFNYAWTVTKNGLPFATGSAANFTFTPDDNGTYHVSLTVTDPFGSTATDSRTYTVFNLPPTVSLAGPFTGRAQWATPLVATGADPSPVDAASLTYQWNFGDGGTGVGATPSHVYATAGTYNVTVTVTDKDGASATASSTATIAPLGPYGNYIVTPTDNIPNFGANPTIVSVHSGSWSDPTTWSLGRLPTVGDVVSIAANTSVSYDANSTAALDTVVIVSGGHLIFRTDITTKLTVVNLLVLEGGELQIGTEANPVAANVTASVVFADQPINTALDPEQFGHGLIALGKVTMVGAAQSETFARLAVAPRAGDTTLHLQAPATGWNVGDRLLLPDSRQLVAGSTDGAAYVDEVETPTIAAVSADGLTVTLAAPLQYDHPGSFDYGDGINFMPYVADRTRNITVRSANATGTRGHVMFTEHADVDVKYVAFAGLGRTTNQALDNTTFDAQGNVTHLGTNESDRYPVEFRHLIGPATPQADGYQYTFIGNVVFCPLDPMPFRWGVVIDDSHYGLVKDNVIWNWAGAGLVTETGNESFNRIEHNIVIDTTGNGDKSSMGQAGDGYWLHGPNNYVVNNVATDINSGIGGDAFGFNLDLFQIPEALLIPLYQGADPLAPGQGQTVNMHYTSILLFSGNEVYGASSRGLTVWHVGYDPNNPTRTGVPASVISGMKIWNIHGYGAYMYDVADLTLDHYVARDNNWALPETGLLFGDYMANNVTVNNSDIEGFANGIEMPILTVGTTTIENSHFRNVRDLFFTTMWTVGGGFDLGPRMSVISNDRFDALAGQTHTSIDMEYLLANGTAQITPDTVMVYDYNGVTGDDFRVYYLQEDANYIVPQKLSLPLMDGSPDAGLTNAQNWAKYGIAIAGAVAPSTATTRVGISGLVQSF